ncbi:MAG: DEAD/DEAH box helicase [Candidatus Saccharimonadales bacterium]
MSYNNFSPSRGRRAHSVYQSKNHTARRSGPAGRGNHKKYINPALFVRAAKPSAEIAYQPVNKFADFACNPLIKSNLTARDIMTPTPIQDQAIAPGLAGKDVIGIANTGTGKTIAFAVPLLEKLMASRQNRALIMAPTRELAQQIETECEMIARGSSLRGALLIGGSPMGAQLRDLCRNPQIVIGTPGRIKDHLQRHNLDLANFNSVVLDEVDRMLDMGFINDVKLILGNLAKPRQSFLFSATLDDSVKTLINSFVNQPVMISVKNGATSDNIAQDVVAFASNHEKIAKLHDLLISQNVRKALIFDETRRSVERLQKELVARGLKVEAIHGGKSQGQRQRALNNFKLSAVPVLVATDVAARGIDIIDITHVINYSTPNSYEDYAHRIGRAGRAGRPGKALTFIEKSSAR